MKRTITLITVFLITNICIGQTANIKVERIFHQGSFMEFDSFVFIINGTQFKAYDTTIQTIKLNKGLDNCAAIIGKDTLTFATKFKAKNTYIIRPGCCCAYFTLEAEENSRRGTFSFTNHTNQDIGIVVAEANIDTVLINKTKEIFSYESAMCLFKPCSIVLAEIEYLAEKYVYANNLTANYDSLWEEQKKHILAIDFFHFLHGEKIEILYDEKLKTMNFRLNGYLTDDEFEKWWNK